MSSFNQVILIGNLTKEPELRTTQTGKDVANVSIATNKKFKNQAGELVEQVQYHNLVVWNNAKAFCQYLNKGSKVFIKGELATRNYEKEDGTKVYVTEIVVGEFKFLDSKKENTEVKQNNSQSEQIINTFDGKVVEDEEIRVENIPFYYT